MQRRSWHGMAAASICSWNVKVDGLTHSRRNPAMRFATLLFTAVLAIREVVALPAANHLTPVNLRIEGADKTIFEGIVLTKGHNVTTVSGGTHHCDGTNNGENVLPGPTCTSALDDAAKKEGFAWDGTFFPEFDDYFITSIATSPETATQFWGILINFQFTPVGGCQQEITHPLTDKVLWAFDAFNAAHFLSLAGPLVAKKGVPTTFLVTDGSTGAAVAGAAVDASGASSGADGKVVVTFGKAGLHSLKATLEGSVRSNKVDVLVHN
ncbi:Surface cell-adhesion protein [Mycena indigotica]|uniref:Surface cell-adhesion protein n=1 Tax=Mycena indigotica TaxID=2126181 RepID=A0A8H6W402_9AGAR|nr:Surface cell-adhesion protein [Mycena indigotica]KAF7304112.1 Surface cell-adhesion protein [Mycena indigotica]